MLKIIAAIVVAIIVMVAVVAFIGSRLPVAHVASRSVVINAPTNVVFSTMTDFASAPAWRSGLKSVVVSTDTTDGHQRVLEDSKSGKMTMEVEELVPPTRFVTRIVDEGLPYGGAWAHAIEPQGNATKVTITEHGEVYNPVFRFISKYLIGHTGTMDTYLADLGRKFGADVTPVDAAPVPLK
jgi:uncharacterized protein YndB with AHSA1/START domain